MSADRPAHSKHVFYEEPMLQQQRWGQRESLASLVFDKRWGQGSEIFEPANDVAQAAEARR